MKVYLRTYGCRANQYDSEAVRAMLLRTGAHETDDASEADVAVFNSCTVTAAAEADLRADVRAAARSNRTLRTVVIGCAPGVRARDEALAPLVTLPSVRAVVSGGDVSEVAEALGLTGILPRAGAPGGAQTSRQTTARALLRIQDGCDEHCTFCATTISRGANRSRPAEEILEEASALAETHPEIVLTGIHIGTYGRDTGSSLGELVESLIDEVRTVRFRITSVEATEVDDRLGELLVADPQRLAPHLHAPLQSGSDAVLRRMGRNWYSAASYAAAVRRIVSGTEVFALSADVITGFPGETEADHRSTLALVRDLPFTSLHVFPYSPRPGTSAVRLGRQVPGPQAKRRSAELRNLAAEKGAAYRTLRESGACDVVVTERGRGLTEDYLSVAVSDASIPRRARFCGTLRQVNDELTAFPGADTHA